VRLLILAALLAVLASVGGVSMAPGARAQADIEVRSEDVQNRFPEGILFTLLTASASPIEEVRLRYSIAPDGAAASGVAECTGEAVVNCTFELQSKPRTFLPPGTEITYFWDISDTAGSTLQTEPQLFVYEDTRFDWQSVSEGNLTVWWYAGSEDEARAVLHAALESLQGIGELLDTAVEFPVKVFYYADVGDMEPAVLSSEAEGVLTLGEVVFSDTAMVSGDVRPLDIARHEVAHIVIRQATKGPFGIPDWLNEGTAVFAQSELFSDQQTALETAIRRNEVFSIRSLSSASVGATASNVGLFYGQSWSVVAFLVETYGPEKFAELFAVFKEGSTTGNALMTVYGFDQDGLETAWRQSVGLPPREPPTPSPEEPSPQPQATATPSEEPAATEDSDEAFPIAGIVVAGVLTVVIAGTVVVGGVVLARRWR
jgi:hypothetical protein